MDPPRHLCRGRPMVCTGPCNPLRAHHHHHHHHHHHRHHRQKAYMSDKVSARENMPLSDESVPVSTARGKTSDNPSEKSDNSSEKFVNSSEKFDNPKEKSDDLDEKSCNPDDDQKDGSTDDESVFATSSLSSSKTALANVSFASRKARIPEKAEVSATSTEAQDVLSSQKELDTMKTAKECREDNQPTQEVPRAFSQRIVATRTSITQVRKVTVRPVCRRRETFRSRAVRGMCAAMPRRTSSLCLYLVILIFYAGLHLLMATVAHETWVHQFFVYSQLCGFFVFVMWRITGTVSI